MGSTNSTMSPGSFSKNNSKDEVHPYVESMEKGIITNRMVAEPYGVSRTQSFWDSFSEIPCRISEINGEAVKSILYCLEQKKDMQKKNKLFDLIQLYFSNSFIMSKLCNELENCLKIAHNRQLTLRAAVQLFKEKQGSCENKKDRTERRSTPAGTSALGPAVRQRRENGEVPVGVSCDGFGVTVPMDKWRWFR